MTRWSLYASAAVFACMCAVHSPNAVFGSEALDDPTPTQAKKIDGSAVLPLKVLVRPFSSLYEGPSETSKRLKENLEPLKPFYVYTAPSSTTPLDQGWYQVGETKNGKPIGYLKAADAIEWKQQLVMSYTHPEGRSPVPMFETLEALEKVVKDAGTGSKASIEAIYAAIDAKKIDPAMKLISVEPKQYVDFQKAPYFLPILDYKTTTLKNREARMLKIAAVTLGANSRTASDIRTNTDFLAAANTDIKHVNADVLKNFKIDLVWVMDTTRSMGPYIYETVEVIREASKRLSSNESLAGMINFGIWGFRDSTQDIPGMEYTTRNFTPTLQSIDAFEQTLAGVHDTEVDSVDYEEDAFSGVADAIDKTAWDQNALKVIIVVTDAPGHQVGHKWNASKLNAETLRELADDRKISIGALHIRAEKAGKYHSAAEAQYRMLTRNDGATGDWYMTVDSKDLNGFRQTTGVLSNALMSLAQDAAKIKDAAMGSAAAGASKPTASIQTPAVSKFELPDIGVLADEKSKATGKPDTSAAGLTNSALKAAFVEWLGSASGAESPRDITAYVFDKDLLNTDVQSLDVRVLINKRQLDSLQSTLKTILEAGRRSQLSGDDFFSSLQAASATTARDPELIKKSKTLAQTGLIADFLVGLPYKSKIMEMTKDTWASMSADEQDNFLSDIEALIKAYEMIHDSPDGWISLAQGDDKDETVYPINLNLLP